MKQKAALATVVLIVLLYLSTIVFALMKRPEAEGLLLTSLFLTVVVPALLYGYVMFIRVTRRNREQEDDSER